MSRIGKAPITVPAGVDVTIEGTSVTVKGPQGTLSRVFPEAVSFTLDEGVITVSHKNEDKEFEHSGTNGLTASINASSKK